MENILGRSHTVQHLHVPAACFTHPEIAMVGLTEEQARVRAAEQGFELGKSIGHFRANSKALAENEGDGIAKVTSSTTVLLLLSPILCYYYYNFYSCFYYHNYTTSAALI